MKNLVTVRADNNIKGYTEMTLPLIEEKAVQWNADFILLSDESKCQVSDGRFHYRILELSNLLDKYDRVLNLDADMFITNKCPNPFTHFDNKKIVSIYEDKGSRASHRRNLMNQIQSKWGNVNWKNGYINTGFFMASKEHKKIFDVHKKGLWTGFGFDDVYLGYMIHKNGFEIEEAPFLFNHMTMFSESWMKKDRFDSYIIHYAGRGIYDGKHKTKLEQMKSDYETLYG